LREAVSAHQSVGKVNEPLGVDEAQCEDRPVFGSRRAVPLSIAQPSAASEISDAEFSAIESALLNSGRGRAFLTEHARRNRLSDTQTVLSAIERLEHSTRPHDPAADVQRFRTDVLEMARRIADTRQQIVALRSEEDEDTTFGRARGELDAIVQATESATGSILEAAEQIQEIAWTLREGGFAVETCEAIDLRSTNIYLACSFQDLTSQRIRKVIDAVQFLEGRINQMIDIWGFSADELQPPATSAGALAGPSHDGLKQDEVDLAMGVPVAAAAPAALFDSFDAGFESAALQVQIAPKGETAAALEAEPSDAPGIAHDSAHDMQMAGEDYSGVDVIPQDEADALMSSSDDISYEDAVFYNEDNEPVGTSLAVINEAKPEAKASVPDFTLVADSAEDEADDVMDLIAPVAALPAPSSSIEPETELDDMTKLVQRLSPIDALPVREKLRDFE
jgi:chemotaxis protein CheZ